MQPRAWCSSLGGIRRVDIKGKSLSYGILWYAFKKCNLYIYIYKFIISYIWIIDFPIIDILLYIFYYDVCINKKLIEKKVKVILIISNFSNRNSNILKRVSILHFLLVKISFLPLWFNIILSSFSQLCLLLPLRVYPSGIFELFSFFFFWSSCCYFFWLLAPFLSPSLFFDVLSNANSTLSPLSSKLLFFSFSLFFFFFLASSCRSLHF